MTGNTVVDYVNRLVAAEVARERERCALIAELHGPPGLAAMIRSGEGPKVLDDDEKRCEEWDEVLP